MQPEVLITILGMAAVTFGIRIGGYLLADRLPTTGFVAAWMRNIPGAVLASLVAPEIAGGIFESVAGTAPALAFVDELAGAVATALAYVATRNLFAAMIGGVGTVYLLRTFAGF